MSWAEAAPEDFGLFAKGIWGWNDPETVMPSGHTVTLCTDNAYVEAHAQAVADAG
jgi:hypothetical protein